MVKKLPGWFRSILKPENQSLRPVVLELEYETESLILEDLLEQIAGSHL